MMTYIYLEIQASGMRREYEGVLKKMEKIGEHTTFVIHQYNGRGAIIDVPNKNILKLNIFQAPENELEQAA